MEHLNAVEKIAPALNSACDMLNQVRSVNELLQGLCARLSVAELNKNEGEGLFHLLDWQNEKILAAENFARSAIALTE